MRFEIRSPTAAPSTKTFVARAKRRSGGSGNECEYPRLRLVERVDRRTTVMAIEKRVSSRTGKTSWHVRISLGVNADGTRRRESIGTYDSFEEAQDAMTAGYRWCVETMSDLRGADLRLAD